MKSFPLKKIDYIHHIADVHIRNFKRHREYREVFARLYKIIKSYKHTNAIIYIGGDIVHAKTDMSPELIDITSEFLTKLAEIHPVVLIAGNHDCNLNNKSRMDALYPIIENLNNPNIFYLRETGVYELGDISFSVMSVFDEPSAYPNVSEISGPTKIALFHGPVNNARTDTGFKLSSREISVDTFAGYDMVLLGDIHKRQYLNDEKTIAFCGSLIQQNHGESFDKGYLVWDVKNRTSEFVSVSNDYGYYTIDVDNGVIQNSQKEIPNKARIRLRISNTDTKQLNEIQHSLKKTFPRIQEISVIRSDNINSNPSSFTIGDIQQPDYQNTLIEEYLSKNHTIEDNVLEQIKEINERLNSEIPQSEIAKNVVWKPKTFEFDNMFAYGPGNTLDMSKLRGVIGVFAPNATGKSSILDALSFTLFDKCSRAYKASHIMNNRKNKFKSKVELDLDGKKYVIKKNSERRKYVDDAASVDIDFYHVDNEGKKVSLNGDKRATTNKIIRDYIGHYGDFVLTAMSTQVGNNNFIEMKQSERKDLLAQFLGLQIFDSLYDLANEEVRDIAALIREFEKVDYEEKLEQAAQNLANSKSEYSKQIKEKELIQNEVRKLNDTILSLTKKLIKVNKELNIDSLEKDKKRHETKKNELEQKISVEKEDLKILISQLQKLKEEMVERFATIKDDYARFLEVEKSAIDNKATLEKLEIKVSHVLEKVKTLKDLEYDENCHYCMTNPFNIDAMKAKENLKDLRAEVLPIIQEKERLEKELTDLSPIKDLYLEYEKSMEKIRIFTNSQEKQEILIDKMETELDEIAHKLNRTNELIEEYFRNEATIKKNAEIENEIASEKMMLNEVSDKLAMKERDVRELHSRVELYKAEIVKIKELMQKYNENLDAQKAYSLYIEAVKRDGIPYQIISDAVPAIETEINEILSQIVDFRISLEIDGKNINGYIVYDSERKWPVELISGMERFITSTAIRVALLNISSIPRPNFLAIDEGFGSLDSDNINSMYLLFDYLKQSFDFILVISHLDTMRDMVDSILEIKKVNGYSKLTY